MEQNELYPIFLKLHELEVLIVGGGFVGLEKLSFLLKSSPNANVTLASITISDEIKSLAKKHTIKLLENVSYNSSLLKGKHIVMQQLMMSWLMNKSIEMQKQIVCCKCS